MMTGRDLIIYILQNNLEDTPVFDDLGGFLGFLTVDQAAVKFNVGVETIIVWASMGWVENVRISGVLYIPANAKRPEFDPTK